MWGHASPAACALCGSTQPLRGPTGAIIGPTCDGDYFHRDCALWSCEVCFSSCRRVKGPALAHTAWRCAAALCRQAQPAWICVNPHLGHRHSKPRRCGSQTPSGCGCSKASPRPSGVADRCGERMPPRLLLILRGPPAPKVCSRPSPAPPSPIASGSANPLFTRRPSLQLRRLRPAGGDAGLPHLPMPPDVPPALRAPRRLPPERPQLSRGLPGARAAVQPRAGRGGRWGCWGCGRLGRLVSAHGAVASGAALELPPALRAAGSAQRAAERVGRQSSV
jgi:hypothetical protein